MPHLDDGTLSAYLDGALDALEAAAALPAGMTAGDVEAHLRACTDCRSRLAAERASRDGAHAVLADAVPRTVELPPFEMIGGAAEPAARRRRLLPLAWAASVVVALGAGWAAGVLLRDMPAGDRNAARVADAGAQQESAQASAAPATGGRERAAENAVADNTVAGDAAMTTRPPAAAGLMERAGAASLTVPTAEPQAAAPAAVASESARVQADRSVADVSAERRALDVTVRTAGSVDARIDSAAAATGAVPMGVPVTTSAAAPPPAPLAAPRLGFAAQRADARLEDLTAKLGHPDQALASFRSLLGQVRADSLVWLELQPDDRRRAAQPLYLVDGARTLMVEQALAGPGRLIRARQRDPDHGEFELVLWYAPRPVALDEVVVSGAPLRARTPRAGAEARPAPVTEVAETPIAGGVRELVLHAPATGVWIGISGALPPASLRALAQRLVETR
jgi:hypothetical protein